VDPIRVLLVDDHALFRRGLVNLLRSQSDFEVVGEAEDGQEALEKARALMPDIILMDIAMPKCDGLKATRLIQHEMPHAKIVMLTVSDQEQTVYEAIKTGAVGYLLKDLEPDLLYGLVRSVAAGQVAISPAIAGKLLRDLTEGRGASVPARPRQVITPREKEVLELVVTGLANKEIAHRLGISESTVRNHLHNILDKLHLQNRVQLAMYASREGLVDQQDLPSPP
jgi:two-component system nitrate/nitrite response regulator NarL